MMVATEITTSQTVFTQFMTRFSSLRVPLNAKGNPLGVHLAEKRPILHPPWAQSSVLQYIISQNTSDFLGG
jgi:hypothetical protein